MHVLDWITNVYLYFLLVYYDSDHRLETESYQVCFLNFKCNLQALELESKMLH